MHSIPTSANSYVKFTLRDVRSIIFGNHKRILISRGIIPEDTPQDSFISRKESA
jgi:hypothetical protein